MKRKIMFHGERVQWNGEVWQLFKDTQGKSYWWTGRNVWFGSVYHMEKKAKGEAGWTLAKRPEAVECGWQPTEAETTEYHAHKQVVLAHRQAKRKALQLKKVPPPLARAVESVRPYYLALNHVDQRRFMEWFSNECSKRKGKK